MLFTKIRTYLHRSLFIVGVVAAITVRPAFAAEKPPLSPDQDTPLSWSSPKFRPC
jgi:hypothetical protein